MKKLLTALVASLPLILAIGGAAAQAPPPVPALPDAARQTGYTISSGVGPYAVGFDIYGDGTDYCNWLDVWIDGTKLTCATDWTLSLASGTLSTAARPLTNARVTLTTPRTGALFIDGQRRPRRIAQFPENRGVSARDLNQLNNDIVAMLREQWDYRKRLIVAPDGDVMNGLPTVAVRRNMILGFDFNGQPIAVPQNSGGGAPIADGRLYYAEQQGFHCDGTTDDTPAWNAFMAAVKLGSVPPFSKLVFSTRATGNSYCRFQSRPAQVGNTLRIDGSPWLLRDYQPGAVLTVSAAVSGTGGVVRLTVNSTAAITEGQQVGVFAIVGTTEANGLRNAHIVDATHLELTGTTFSNAYTSGGKVLTAPLEPFIELGPQQAGDVGCNETWLNNTLVYAGANTLGGIAVDIGSFNQYPVYGGCISPHITNLVVGESTGGRWGVVLRIDGSNAPGFPNPGDFAGIREPVIDNVFSRNGLFSGVWVRAAGAPKITNIQIVTFDFNGTEGDLRLDGLAPLNGTYSAYITGTNIGSIITGAYATASTIEFASVYSVNVSHATNTAILIQAGFCNNEPPVLTGVNIRVDCNGDIYTTGTVNCPSCTSTLPQPLTRTNDTNVTLSLTGLPATSLVNPVGIAVGWAGTLAAVRGGLGADFSAATGVPLFAAGTATATGTTGTDNFVRATSPTIATPTLITPAISNPVFSGTATGNNTIPLSILAQAGANSLLGNVTGSTANVTAISIPTCADTGGNHLNYTVGAFTCGNSGGTGGATGLGNSTVTIGLAAVNGSAVTALRTDSAPALSTAVQTALTGTNFGVLLGTGAFGFGATAAMTNGQLLVGQTGANPLPKTATGDISITAAGATSITAAGRAGNYTDSHVYVAQNLAALGGGLINFACDGSTNDTPAWNAFMAATAMIPMFSKLWFAPSASNCRFATRPNKVMNTLWIDGNHNTFVRDYQPGAIGIITLITSGVGGEVVLSTGPAAHGLTTGDSLGIAFSPNPSANGFFLVTVIDTTSFRLTGTTFTGSGCSGGGNCGAFMTTPLQGFIEMGPTSPSDTDCSATRVSNLYLLNTSTGGGFGGSALSLASYPQTGRLGGCLSTIVENIVVQNTASAWWGASLNMDGSSATASGSAYKGLRDPVVRGLEGHAGLFYGLHLRSVVSASISDVNLIVAAASPVPMFGMIRVEGASAPAINSAGILLTGQFAGWDVVVGPNASSTNVIFGVINKGVILSSTGANSITAASCVDLAAQVAGVDNKVICNGITVASSPLTITSPNIVLNTPILQTLGSLSVNNAAAGYALGVKSDSTNTFMLNSTAGCPTAGCGIISFDWYVNGALQMTQQLRPDAAYNYYITNALTGGVLLTAGGTSWASASDRNLKRDFAPISVLDKIAAHPDVDFLGSFIWKQSGKRDEGFIAQDVWRVFPGIVEPGDSDASAVINDLAPIDSRTWNAKKDMAGVYALQGLKELLRRVEKLEAGR